MNKIHIIKIICLGLLLAASTTLAKDKTSKGARSADLAEVFHFGQPEPAEQVKWGFSQEERRIVQSYLEDCRGKHGRHGKTLPPGLSKKVARTGKLPPGWQQKCVVGEIMPAAVYDQCHPLPGEVVTRMPPPPEPTLTVTIGGKVVRLLKATREILDVFEVDI